MAITITKAGVVSNVKAYVTLNPPATAPTITSVTVEVVTAAGEVITFPTSVTAAPKIGANVTITVEVA